MVMRHGLRQAIDAALNRQVRPALWAIRARSDISVIPVVLRVIMGVRHRVGTTRDHVSAAMGWLCAAQDATGDGGVAAFYDVTAGAWAPPYPETTGYIVPTFFDYAAYASDDSYRTRAVRMADWLLSLQLENGAFPMGPLWAHMERVPIVFDTGQVIHGLVRTFEETGDSRYLKAANRACDWLIEVQEVGGRWRKFNFLGHENTYNTCVARALLQVSEVSRDIEYRRAAARNLAWTLTQQIADGWFRNAGFTPGEEPLTHTIAYTIRGLLESGKLLSDPEMVEAARRAADALRSRQVQDGYLRGTYGPGWRSSVTWSCLTGNAQMALVWLRLYEMTGEDDYIQSAHIANHYVKRVQPRGTGLVGIDGGIPGSFPIYRDYHPYLYPNWAAKFFVDSLLLEERLQAGRGIG